MTWERLFDNGEWRPVGQPLSLTHRLKFDSAGSRTYRSSIYLMQMDEPIKSDAITVTRRE